MNNNSHSRPGRSCSPFRLSQAGALAFAVGFALHLPVAQADILGDVKSNYGKVKNVAGKAGECVQSAAKAGLITGEAATKILGLLSDPMGAACVAQVTLPDPLTIGVSAAMVVANFQGKLHQGTCNQEVRDAAFEPIVDGISSLTGLKLDQPPLSDIVLEGKDKAWDYLNKTPPASLVLSKVACGCTFIDNGISYETAAKVAKAYTEAGESCFAFAEAAVQLVCESGKAADKVCDLVGGAAKAVNNAAESLFQDSAVPWEQYYDTWWKYFESDYIGKSIAGGGPIGEGVKLQAKNGYAQVDPMAYNNKTIAEAKADSKKYFDNHKNSKSSAAEKSNWLAGRFTANAQPFIDLGLKQVQFAKVAKGHVEANIKVWDKEFDPEDYYGKQAAKIIALPKSGTVTLEKGLIPGGDAKTHIAVQFNGAVLTGYAEEAYKIWIQSAGGDAGRMTEALDIAYNKSQKKLDELLATYKAEKKAAKEKDTVIPLRILVADGRLEKLGKLSAGDTCAGVIKPLAEDCANDVQNWINAAAKELKDRCVQSSCSSYNYGQSKDGKYFPFEAIYKYSPTIAARQDWVSNDKYNAVLKQADDRVAYYEERIAAVGKRFAEYGATHSLLMGAWTSECGAAVGTPGAAATPMCESMLSSAIANCLTEGNSALKGASAAGMPGGAAGVNAPAGVGAKTNVPGASPAQGPQGNNAAGKGNAATGAKGVAAGAPPNPNAGKPAAGVAMGADLGKPAQCRSQIETALQQYAVRHKASPGGDKPYPSASASMNEIKEAAKKAGTKPGDLSKTSGIVGINNAAPAPSADARKAGDASRNDPKAKTPAATNNKPTSIDPNAINATKQGTPPDRGGNVTPPERATIGSPASPPTTSTVRDAAGRATAPNAPAVNAPAGLPAASAPAVPPLPVNGGVPSPAVPPVTVRTPTPSVGAGLPVPNAPSGTTSPASTALPPRVTAPSPNSAPQPAPNTLPGATPATLPAPSASTGVPPRAPSAAAAPPVPNLPAGAPAALPPAALPPAVNAPPATGATRPAAGSTVPAQPPATNALPAPQVPPVPPSVGLPPAGLPVPPAAGPRPPQAPGLPAGTAPAAPPAPGLPAAPGLPSVGGAAGTGIAAELDRAGCKPTPQAVNSFTCATRTALDACEAAKRAGKVAACVQGR